MSTMQKIVVTYVTIGFVTGMWVFLSYEISGQLYDKPITQAQVLDSVAAGAFWPVFWYKRLSEVLHKG